MTTAVTVAAPPREHGLSRQHEAQWQQWLIGQLAMLAVFRQAELDQETLELFAAKLSQYERRDICSALDRLAHTRRAEGETAFPDLPTLEDAIRSDATRRMNAERERAR